MPSKNADPRAAFLRAMVGPKPSPDAVLRVAVNTPPRDGEGRGTWREEAVADAEAAAEYLARSADRAEGMSPRT